MEQSVNVEVFTADPIGKVLVGPTWLYFYPSHRVSGFVLWGRLTEADLRVPAQITPSIHARADRTHMAIIDARRVEHVEPAAFTVAAEYVKRHRRAIEGTIARLAIVHGQGLLGAIAAGFFRIVRPPCTVELFGDPLEASRWLAVEHATELFAELSTLQALAAGTEPLLRDIRAVLKQRLRSDLSVADVARTLRLSQRTLQRRLAQHGTSFQHEVALARVRRAETLLADTDRPLTEIAVLVGCASLYHFTTMFKKVSGESPANWRAKRRDT